MQRSLERRLKEAAFDYGEDAVNKTHKRLVSEGKFTGDIDSYFGILSAELAHQTPKVNNSWEEDELAVAYMEATRVQRTELKAKFQRELSDAEAYHRKVTDPLAELSELRAVLEKADIEEPEPQGPFKTLTQWHGAVMQAGYAALHDKYNPKPKPDAVDNVTNIDDHRRLKLSVKAGSKLQIPVAVPAE